jgi:hypothetical protein
VSRDIHASAARGRVLLYVCCRRLSLPSVDGHRISCGTHVTVRIVTKFAEAQIRRDTNTAPIKQVRAQDQTPDTHLIHRLAAKSKALLMTSLPE